MSELTFHPGNVQFLLYDVGAVSDGLEDNLWTREGETDGPLSIRTGLVAVGLFDDAPVRLRLSVHPERPASPLGVWEVQAEASILVGSGVLGLRAADDDEPRLRLALSPGTFRMRVCGRQGGEAQTFHVQFWPQGF